MGGRQNKKLVHALMGREVEANGELSTHQSNGHEIMSTNKWYGSLHHRIIIGRTSKGNVKW